MEKEHRELLQQLFENVNTWLHFVEAKNAAIIAMNIAFLAALISSSWLESYETELYSIIIGLLVSTTCSLYSFNPINKPLEKTDSIGIDDNLLHYAFIASLERDEYLKKLYEQYWTQDNINDISKIEKDYADEIIQNSRICTRKQRHFKRALHIDFLIILVTGIWIICA